ncbi:MAG: metalloregulator ArsR/SmtB family transcription factor, partial [Fimbriimonadaceae bacterium]|nr:metalloregulator ArsR/SmtB family transcription factor [Fimbriimonadaceae bacterium]
MLDLVRELVEPSRRALIAELKAGPRTVNDLVTSTGLKQPNVSNHLARLRSKGVLKAVKVGRQVFYSFASPEIAQSALQLIGPNPVKEAPREITEELIR